MTTSLKVDLVGVGLNATDTLISVANYPTVGSKVEFHTSNILPGGQTATTVMACQQWGMRTRYVGKLGDDDASELHRRAFADAGVETRLITVDRCSSQQSVIIVDSTGERTVLSKRDERLELLAGDLQREWIVNARALHVDGYDTAGATVATAWARAAGVPVIADLDEIYPGVDDLIANIDYLIVSRDFPSRLMDEPDLEKALSQMQKRYGCRLTAATLGPDGVLAWDGKQFHYTPAYRVPVRDTTGAGDLFHSGFIYGLLQGWPLSRQLDFGCAAAALNCMGVGARGGIQTVETIEQLMATGERYMNSTYAPCYAPSAD